MRVLLAKEDLITKRRFPEEQIIGILREQEAGGKVKDIIRRHGAPCATDSTRKTSSKGWYSACSAMPQGGLSGGARQAGLSGLSDRARFETKRRSRRKIDWFLFAAGPAKAC